MKIPVYRPYLPPESLYYAHKALDDGHVANGGPYVYNVTEQLQSLVGIKHVIPVNNGTSATHLLIKALRYKYPGIRNIIVPNNSYVAVYNSILYEGYHNIIAIDANLDTWNMDLSKIDHVPDDTAIMVVHNLGNIINVPRVHRRFPNAIIIEDNCEGFTGRYEGKYSGTDCLVSSISTFINKQVTSGEGGAVFTNDSKLAEYITLVKRQGQGPKRFIHELLGNNFRMSNLQAALLLGQLQLLDEILDMKSDVFDYYKKHLEGQTGIVLQKEEPNTERANWMFGLKFVGGTGYAKAEKFFEDAGIETRPMFYSTRYHSYLGGINMECDEVAQILSNEVVILPSWPGLTTTELDYIIEWVLRYRDEIG